MYAADRSTLLGSLPEKAPPPWGAAAPYVSTMIFRPVSPVSAAGPPRVKEPEGLTRKRVRRSNQPGGSVLWSTDRTRS